PPPTPPPQEAPSAHAPTRRPSTITAAGPRRLPSTRRFMDAVLSVLFETIVKAPHPDAIRPEASRQGALFAQPSREDRRAARGFHSTDRARCSIRGTIG